MSEPLVCCVMLTRDRPEMAARAVRCFREQTYGNKRLLIWDNGKEAEAAWFEGDDGEHVCTMPAIPFSIGAMRNFAAQYTAGKRQPQILIHWDDDDYSHPNRIAEQVALLQSSGAEAVGYRELLFWRTDSAQSATISLTLPKEEAWIWSHPAKTYCAGTSLCYWRETWERRPFPDLPTGIGPERSGRGEETAWLREVKSVAVKSIINTGTIADNEPRLIASIHASNARHYKGIEKMPGAWRRAPEWDAYARNVMAL